jgi:hypothetical protein
VSEAEAEAEDSRVTVVAVREMDGWAFDAHIRLRHAALRFASRSRGRHNQAHRLVPPSFFDHVHEEWNGAQGA